MSNKNPIVSVTKPGSISKQAANAIDAPEIISNNGISFLYKLYIPSPGGTKGPVVRKK